MLNLGRWYSLENIFLMSIHPLAYDGSVMLVRTHCGYRHDLMSHGLCATVTTSQIHIDLHKVFLLEHKRMSIFSSGKTRLNVSGPPTWSNFANDNIDGQKPTTKRHYDRKYIHIQIVMLLIMYKNLHDKNYKLWQR